MIEEFFFAQRAELFEALTTHCASVLRRGIEAHDHATVFVSGGSTPLPLYRQLSRQELSWEKVDIALVDERWVNPGQPGSNETAIVDSLLKNRASEAAFFGMKTAAATPTDGEVECETRYRRIHCPFDLCILGLGADGHTASLFPHAGNLAYALDENNARLCTHIQARESAVTGKFTERMTLTLNAIRACNTIILLITGEEKLEVYRTALHSRDTLGLPVSALLHGAGSKVSVYWAP